jgi:Rod binding domain-containing protein
MDPLASPPLSTTALGIDTAQFARTAPSAKLHKAAQDFEALLLGEMLKSTRESGSEGWLGSGDGDGNDAAMELAESQLARALALGGGLGVGQLIEKQLTRPGDQNKNAIPGEAAAVSAK